MTDNPEVLEQITTLAVDAAAKVVEAHGRLYTASDLKELPIERAVEPLQLHSLTSLVDWYKRQSDGVDPTKLTVHVTSPNSVMVIGDIRADEQNRRHTHIHATSCDYAEGFIGRYNPQTDFIVGLLTRFLNVAGDDRADAMRFVGTLTDEAIKTSVDDGITQQVTCKKGIAGLVGVSLPNVVTLHPRRSFAEVGAVPELFVLRVRGNEKTGSEVALFSADAGAWRHDCIQRIGAWLRDKLGKDARVLA